MKTPKAPVISYAKKLALVPEKKPQQERIIFQTKSLNIRHRWDDDNYWNDDDEDNDDDADDDEPEPCVMRCCKTVWTVRTVLVACSKCMEWFHLHKCSGKGITCKKAQTKGYKRVCRLCSS